MHCSANQGGTAEFIWSFGPLSEMAEDFQVTEILFQMFDFYHVSHIIHLPELPVDPAHLAFLKKCKRALRE